MKGRSVLRTMTWLRREHQYSKIVFEGPPIANEQRNDAKGLFQSKPPRGRSVTRLSFVISCLRSMTSSKELMKDIIGSYLML